MLARLISLIITACFYATALSAGPPSTPPFESVYFNVGTHTEFYNAVQIDEDGGQRKFQIAPTLGAGLVMPLGLGWKFLPELNWVLPFHKETNDRIIKNVVMMRADFGYHLLDWLRPRIGTGLIILNQHGRGGNTSIDNGNTTSTFYYPDENHSSINNTFDLGLEFIHQDWSARLQTYTYALFRKERRQVSYTLFITYDWDL